MTTPLGEDPPIAPMHTPFFLTHKTTEAVVLTIEPWWYEVNDDIKAAINTLLECAGLEPQEVSKLVCVMELPEPEPI